MQSLFALDEALRETLEEGVPARIGHYRSLMALMQSRLRAMGIRFLLDDDAYGHTLVSCHLPAGVTYHDLHRDLKAQGYVIYAAQGALKTSAFRLGIIGHFGEAEVTGFLDALEARLSA